MATRARTKAAQHPYVWSYLNGSAAYADIDSGVAVAMMRIASRSATPARLGVFASSSKPCREAEGGSMMDRPE